MLISEAIARSTALTGQVTDNAALVRWLSELDGRLAIEFYRADAWTPYDPTDDLSCEPDASRSGASSFRRAWGVPCRSRSVLSSRPARTRRA